MIRTLSTAVCLLGFAVPPAFSETLTLQQALSGAESHSPRIEQASSELNEAQWRKIESRSTFLPTVTGTVQYLSDYKYAYTDIAFNGPVISVPGIIPTTTYGVDVEYNLFEGFSGVNRARAASSYETAAEETLSWERFATSREVTLQFYRALAAKTLQTVSQENLKNLEEHLRDAKLLRRSGMSTNYDLLRVDVQVSEARAEVMNTADEIDAANGRLGELLNMEEPPQPQGQLPQIPASAIDALDRKVEVKRADVRALRARVEGLNREQSATAGHWFPRVGIFGAYQYYNNRTDELRDWDNFRDAYQVGVRLSWNLFEGFAGEARHRIAVEQRVQGEKTLRMAQLKSVQDAAVWKRKFHYYYSVFQSRQSDIGKAAESVRLAKEGRRVGARTSSELLDAETDLHRAQAGAVTAQLGLIEALINLELATGRKLYEFN